MENLFTYTPAQHEMIALLFSGAVAAALAGFIWFAAMLPRIAPRYRNVTIMSMIVMAVAGWHFYRLGSSWEGAFLLQGQIGADAVWVPTDRPFTNNLRYVSWLITIPLLLVQLTYLFDLPREQLYRVRVALVVLGELMVITGYIGAVYETSSTLALLLWGGISTIPFIGMIVILARHLKTPLKTLPPRAATTLRNITYLFAATWGAYPIAYLLGLAEGPEFVVARQFLYTFADVGSKVVYGVLLSLIARRLSAVDGFAPSVADPSIAEPHDLGTRETGPSILGDLTVDRQAEPTDPTQVQPPRTTTI